MRILIVEDEIRLAASIAKALREEGYAVDSAETGDDGLFKAQQHDYDLILLDVMLPKMDGWAVLAELRKSKSTPVLMLTAMDAHRHRVRGLDGGADDYLVKPFDLSELFARVRALIRRAHGKAQDVIMISDIEIDTRARAVTSAGNSINLTAREYGVLEYLALREGQIVTRTELYEHLFDETEDSMSNLIDVHISGIRKKLGKSIITTKRGLGYCLEADS